jgi:putative addiction module component (TIGR02574 family)
MSKTLLKTAMKLSSAERILLVEQLWDSIAESGEAPALTDAQQVELNRRLQRLEKTGPLGSDLATIKARITGRGKV